MIIRRNTAPVARYWPNKRTKNLSIPHCQAHDGPDTTIRHQRGYGQFIIANWGTKAFYG